MGRLAAARRLALATVAATVSVQGLHKRYGGQPALDDVTLSVRSSPSPSPAALWYRGQGQR